MSFKTVAQVLGTDSCVCESFELTNTSLSWNRVKFLKFGIFKTISELRTGQYRNASYVTTCRIY
jgi:hypothetical protein